MAIKVSILGINLISASLALALRESDLDVEIIGHDADDRVSKEAQSKGILDKGRWNQVNAAASGDVIIISLPMADLEHTLERIGRDVQSHALVLDLSLLKTQPQKWADEHLKNGHFVGIAPVLAAKSLDESRQGIEGARADLFKDSLLCVIPSPKAAAKAVESAVNLGTSIGASPFFLDLMEYDALAAAIEILPGLVAASMFGAVNDSNSWRDILKFAGSTFALSTLPLRKEADLAHMAVQSKAATLYWLKAAIEQLKLLSARIEDGDMDILSTYFTELGVERDRWMIAREKNRWDDENRPEWSNLEVSMMDRLVGRRPPKDSKE